MKRFILFLCLTPVLFGLSPAFAAQEDDDAKYRSDMEEGVSLLRAGTRDEISRAIARFKSALKVRPESAESYYWLALAYSDQHNYLRAADNAKDATIYDDAMPEAWSLWGQALMYQKDWMEAMAKLETAARLDPEDPVIQFNLGRVYYHGMKDPDSALSKFRISWQKGQAVRRDNPEMIALTVRSRLYMGCCEYERGLRNGNPMNFENAINAFRDVVKEQPDNYDAMLRLALALRKANRSTEAEHILNSLVKAVEQAGENADKQFLAEINLQLADLYIKDPQYKSGTNVSILAPDHLRAFVSLVGDSNHPALEAVREYLAQADRGQ
ncbi:MAG: tetratricopeptide repeat protein [Planctomycetota bacterium]|jgi:tetratricopeptide (TPR) repeat protein|nr:tetratricopeptide repeat protein [Planctomycetota bacterium]